MAETPLRIEVNGKTSVSVSWEEGSDTELSAAQLRSACMCAGCREAAGAVVTATVLAGPEPVTIESAELVGGYALRFTFGPDGHSTGIYPFEILKKIAEQPS